MIKSAAAALAALALSATAAGAQTPAPTPTTVAPPSPSIVRGTVTAMTDASLTIKTAKGPQTVGLIPAWSVAVMKPVAIDAIQPGSFIGTSEMPSKDGATGKSLEVHVFPPGVKMGEGHYGWDLKPGSMMTNGTVGTVVTGKKGSRELDVSYSSGTRHLTEYRELLIRESLDRCHETRHQIGATLQLHLDLPLTGAGLFVVFLNGVVTARPKQERQQQHNAMTFHSGPS